MELLTNLSSLEGGLVSSSQIGLTDAWQAVYRIAEAKGSRPERQLFPVLSCLLETTPGGEKPTAVVMTRYEDGHAVVQRQEAVKMDIKAALGMCSSAKSQEPPPGRSTVTFAIKVNLPDRAVFYVTIMGDGEMSGIVPLPQGRFAGIRITPRTRGRSVRIEASTLITANKKVSEATCAEVRSWNSKDAGSYDAKEDASLFLAGLGRLGLPVLEVKVVRAGGPPPTPGSFQPTDNSLAFCGCEYPTPRSTTNPDGSSASGVGGVLS